MGEDPRFRQTEECRNRHYGERVFIVATGPSLSLEDLEKLTASCLEDLEKLKNENTISMNSIVNVFSKTDFRPTYYMKCMNSITEGLEYILLLRSCLLRKLLILIILRILHWQKYYGTPECSVFFSRTERRGCYTCLAALF